MNTGYIYDKQGRVLAIPHEETVLIALRDKPGYRRATLVGAVEELLAGDRYVACASLRRLIAVTVGFSRMAEMTGIHEKSLIRMLGPKGNPTTDNLFKVIRVLAGRENVRFAVKEAKPRQAA